MSNTVPSGWSVHELGDLAHKIEGGGTPSRTEASFWNGNIPWATVKDLRAVSLRSTEEHITELGLKNSSSKLIPANTIIIATRMAVGKAVFFDRDVAINQDLKAFHPKNGINWRFLLQWYLAKSEKIESLATGSTVKGIRLDELKLLPIDLPPLPEQQKIAAILSSVDDVIEKTRAQIDKLKDLKTGMMQELLTKGIGHTEFKDSPVGRIPSNWYCVKMNTIAKVNDGAHHTPTYTSSGIPFLRVTDLKSKHIFTGSIKYISREEHSELIKRCKPEKGDILYSKNGTIGIPRLIDWDDEFSIFVSLALIKITSAEVDPEYLALFMDSPIVREQIRARSKQGTVTNLHLEEIRDFDIPLPSMDEQQKITRALNSVVHRLNVAFEKYDSNQKLKKALMQDLLNGKVRVKVDQKEPAVA